MTENSARPTWKLGSELLPGTFPAAQLDADEALRAALDCRQSHERMQDVVTLTKAAAAYAAETMRDALGEFAIMVRDAGPEATFVNAAGWRVKHMPGPSHSTIDLMVDHPSEPGGWFFSFHFVKAKTDFAAALSKKLRKQIREADEAKGLSPQEAVMRELFPQGDLSKDEAVLQELERHPGSYREARQGDAIRTVSATAIKLERSGAPEGVEDAVEEKAFLPMKAYPEIWWWGMELNISPVANYDRGEEGQLLSGYNGRSGASQHIPLRMLSDFIVANGLLDRVKALDEETSKRSWKSYLDEKEAALLEAGHAFVHAAGGVFDQSVVDRIAAFSAGIAAQDVERHVEQWVDIAPRLVEQGYDEKSRYDCNDGRTICDASADDENWLLRLSTQNGDYLMRIATGEDGKVERLDAYRDGSTMMPVGRFVRSGDGLSADYGKESQIPYNIRNVRDMNEIILAWSSIACCFDEEHPRQTMSMG